MNKGEKRRARRRYRVRYDRIVIMALILIAVIVVVSTCVLAISGKKNPKDTRSSTSQPETSSSGGQTSGNEGGQTTQNEPGNTQPERTTEAADDGFTTESHPHDDIYKGDQIVVNAENEYKFLSGDLDLLTVVDNKNEYYTHGDFVTKLDKTTLTKLNEMMEAYAKASSLTSTDIFVQDGFRTFEEQADRHSSGKSSTFEAGHCDYHSGRTFDMFRMFPDGTTPYFAAEGDCAWFADNACKYGFIVRYPEGKDSATGEKARTYTYRYVGAPHASYMHENGLCLEEYISELKEHTKDDPLTVAVDGAVSIIYYVPASSGDTDVPVPKDKAYTVSGNNSDGFIVTVTQ